MNKLSFFDPSGRTEVTRSHAPRLDSLNGKRVGLLSNDQWQAYRTLPLVAECLQTDFPDCEILPLDAFPQGVSQIASPDIVDRARALAVDAIIVGNAA